MLGNDIFEALYDNLEQVVDQTVDNAEGFIREKAQQLSDAASASFEWIWEALQGDFNEDMSTGQIAANALLGLIPIVDQILDCRDLAANCRKIHEEPEDSWAWVALVLTLIGSIPTLGSAVKGVLKIIFLFVRKSGGDMAKALGRSLKPINTFLLDPKAQKVLGNISVPSALKDVVKKLNSIKSMLSTSTLLNLFDEVINTFKGLIAKLKSLAPDEVITWMESALRSMQYVRTQADKMLPNALKEAIYKLEDLELALKKQIKSLEQPHKALADTKSIHRLDDSVAQIDPHIIRSMKNSQKGIYGEIISDHHMKERGFINLLPEDRQVRKMTDKPRGRGIDGIYKNPKHPNPPPPYVVTETKFRTEAGKYIDDDGIAKDTMLSTTKGSKVNGMSYPPAKQMSDDWIEPRMKDELTRGELTNISMEGYERWLLIVDDSGKVINITKLDEKAKAIGKVEL
ncbi:hypothetical protein [Vibrio campbellii]|uniref:Pre-toxin TG domain-containing protein n=1 Tax=Vibrio campbellii TaxID=680 RepID=A0ABY5I9Z4_9VIBR|nr:hypothetical protein [Vibrio campbellii]UTZ22434.1 hypothetical protein HB760_11250 [Vibrio campbellii]UTZ30148.1 hypothetical protein HB762_01290 [Vibrio campbellii]